MFFDDYRQTIAVPKSSTCAAVKLALKFYHDQVVYLPADMNCGAKVEIPRSCPIVHPLRNGVTKMAIEGQVTADRELKTSMLRNGLGPPQITQIEKDSATLDQCSNRAKPGEHNPAHLREHKKSKYPPNMHAHVQNLKAYQTRDRMFMTPNVNYTKVDFGCGGPFSPECLTGWDIPRLLTHRSHLWSDRATHPKRCTHHCLAGWSGADLDAYREAIWPGEDPFMWREVDYVKFAPRSMFKHTKHWAVLDYSNISHLHADQWFWDETQFVRLSVLKNGQIVHVNEKVSVPVPERLHRAFCVIFKGSLPGPPPPSTEDVDQASIGDILERLGEAFEEEEPLTGRSSQQLTGTVGDSTQELSTEDSQLLVGTSGSTQEMSTGDLQPLVDTAGNSIQEASAAEGSQTLVGSANSATQELSTEEYSQPLVGIAGSSTQELWTEQDKPLVDTADDSSQEVLIEGDSQPLVDAATDSTQELSTEGGSQSPVAMPDYTQEGSTGRSLMEIALPFIRWLQEEEGFGPLLSTGEGRTTAAYGPNEESKQTESPEAAEERCQRASQA